MNSRPTEPPARRAFGGLLERRLRWGLTWRGVAVLLVLAILITLSLARQMVVFLAVNDPLPGGVLVVEGWGGDDMMRAVLNEWTSNRYERICVTGGPMERGEPLSEYKTHAELGAALLMKVGMPADRLDAVPAPRVLRDRTFASALALRRWFEARGGLPASINVFSHGAHARRTRLLFERAFGPATRVGIIAFDDGAFDPHQWWRYSVGVRVVVDETVAYLYARFLFSPERY